jgi:hypothetical protein
MVLTKSSIAHGQFLNSVSRLVHTVPRLQRLSVYLGLDKDSENQCLRSLSLLRDLQELVLQVPDIYKVDYDALKNKCLRWFHFMEVAKIGIPLKLMALCSEHLCSQAARDVVSFSSSIRQTRVKCRPSGLGMSIFSSQSEYYNNTPEL